MQAVIERRCSRHVPVVRQLVENWQELKGIWARELCLSLRDGRAISVTTWSRGAPRMRTPELPDVPRLRRGSDLAGLDKRPEAEPAQAKTV